MDMLQINLLQNSSIISIILAIKNSAKQRQKLFLMERRVIEKRIKARKLLAARILRNKRRRMFWRSCWIQPELALDVIGKYWEEQVPLYTDERFYKKLRMSRNSFNKLCEDLHSYLFKMDTQLRTAISVHKRIAIALTILKGRSDFWTVADLFHVGRSTVPYIVYEFCDAVIMHYSHLMKFPSTEEERAEIATGFWNQWQFYDCFGAMDGTHIPILCPKASAQDYYNYKSFYSINVLAIVDHKYRFTYAVIGAPGRCNDASILRRSTLFKKFDNNGKNPKMKTKFHLISDAAFPLLNWIMKPYRITNNMPILQQNFNYRLSRARMTIENAFGRMKSRWRILTSRPDITLNNLKKIIKVCMILHNFCEDVNEDPTVFLTECTEEEILQSDENELSEENCENDSISGKIKRIELSKKLFHDGLAMKTHIAETQNS